MIDRKFRYCTTIISPAEIETTSHQQPQGNGVTSTKGKGRAEEIAPLFFIVLYKSCCSSLLQTVRVGLHTRQQICRLMNQAMRNAVWNRCAIHFGSLE
jgi:hypothetical protein